MVCPIACNAQFACRQQSCAHNSRAQVPDRHLELTSATESQQTAARNSPSSFESRARMAHIRCRICKGPIRSATWQRLAPDEAPETVRICSHCPVAGGPFERVATARETVARRSDRPAVPAAGNVGADPAPAARIRTSAPRFTCAGTGSLGMSLATSRQVDGVIAALAELVRVGIRARAGSEQWLNRTASNLAATRLVTHLLQPAVTHPLPRPGRSASVDESSGAAWLADSVCAAYWAVVDGWQEPARFDLVADGPGGDPVLVLQPMTRAGSARGEQPTACPDGPELAVRFTPAELQRVVSRYQGPHEQMPTLVAAVLALEAVLAMSPLPQWARPGLTLTIIGSGQPGCLELFSSPASAADSCGGYFAAWHEVTRLFGAMGSAADIEGSEPARAALQGQLVAANPPFCPAAYALVHRLLPLLWRLGCEVHVWLTRQHEAAFRSGCVVVELQAGVQTAAEPTTGRLIDAGMFAAGLFLVRPMERVVPRMGGPPSSTIEWVDSVTARRAGDRVRRELESAIRGRKLASNRQLESNAASTERAAGPPEAGSYHEPAAAIPNACGPSARSATPNTLDSSSPAFARRRTGSIASHSSGGFTSTAQSAAVSPHGRPTSPGSATSMRSTVTRSSTVTLPAAKLAQLAQQATPGTRITLSASVLALAEPVIATATAAGLGAAYARAMIVAGLDVDPMLKGRYPVALQLAIRMHCADIVIGKSAMLAGQPLRNHVAACVHSRAVMIAAPVMTALARRAAQPLQVSCEAFLAQYALPIEEGHSCAHASEWATTASTAEFVTQRMEQRRAAPPRASPMTIE